MREAIEYLLELAPTTSIPFRSKGKKMRKPCWQSYLDFGTSCFNVFASLRAFIADITHLQPLWRFARLAVNTKSQKLRGQMRQPMGFRRLGGTV